MISTLIVGALAALFVMGLFAPFETLGWWAGWYGEKPGERESLADTDVPKSAATQFVVYLTGIGGTSPNAYSGLEQGFLKALEERLPEAELVNDVFPYAASNKALTGERVFSWFWRRLDAFRGKGAASVISSLINARNFWQVLVSSDSRFGPLYNYATAQHVLGKLLRHGYRIGSGVPITLIGYSGGGQIAVGVAPLLEEAARAQVHIISLGGVMSSTENILEVDSLTHLYGARDSVQRLGYLMFPQRWTFFSWTPWNRARKRGIIRRVLVGPMGHTGKKGYLDPDSRLESGQSYLDRTVELMTSLINDPESLRAEALT